MDNRWHIVRKDGIPGGLYLEWEKFEVVVGRRVMKSENGRKVSVEVKEKTIATYNGNKKIWFLSRMNDMVNALIPERNVPINERYIIEWRKYNDPDNEKVWR